MQQWKPLQIHKICWLQCTNERPFYFNMKQKSILNIQIVTVCIWHEQTCNYLEYQALKQEMISIVTYSVELHLFAFFPSFFFFCVYKSWVIYNDTLSILLDYQPTYLPTYLDIHTFTHIHIHTHIYMHTHICTRIHTYTPYIYIYTCSITHKVSTATPQSILYKTQISYKQKTLGVYDFHWFGLVWFGFFV